MRLADGSPTRTILRSIHIDSGGVSARLAAKRDLIRAIGFGGMSTHKAPPRGIPCLHEDHGNARLLGFIRHKHPQLAKRPPCALAALRTGTGTLWVLLRWSDGDGSGLPSAVPYVLRQLSERALY